MSTSDHPASIPPPSRQCPDSVLTVAKFNEVFVKADGRKIMDKNRPLAWVSLPTSFTSRGYHDLLDAHESERAMAVYGVFMQLVKLSVQAAPYGVLRHSDGSAFSFGFIARTIGVDVTLVEESVRTLIQIRWLVPIPPVAGQCPDTIPPPSGLQTVQTEQNSTEPLSPDSESPDFQTAEFMWDLIHAMQPNRKPPNLNKWADTIRLTRERDDRTDSEIRELFLWCNRNDFWKTNILSPDKLRAKWDNLQLKRCHENDNRSGSHQRHDRPTTNQSIANLAAAAGMCESPGSLVFDETTGHVQQGGSGLLGYDPRHVPD